MISKGAAERLIRNDVIKNAGWIILSKVIQSVLALLIGTLTARYLGPANYGVINYASSLAAFVVPIMQLGLNSIMVQQIIDEPRMEGRILGTSMTMCLVSAGVCYIGLLIFVFCVNPGEMQTVYICLLYGTVLFFQALEMIQYWFQAKLKSKYVSLTMLGSYVVVSAYRVFLLVNNMNVYWFSVSSVLDVMLIAGILHLIYRKLDGQRLVFDSRLIRPLLSKGKYFIVSSLMITVFTQTDKVMLKIMIDEAATGYYAAATTCIFLTNFVFGAIFDSARPVILQKKKQSREVFEESVVILFGIIVVSSLLQCVSISLLGKWIIWVLYGTEYLPAANILRILVWYTLFSYIGMTRSIWILAENLQRYIWQVNMSGAVVNVALNLLLIPRWGINGAAWASLTAQFITNIGVSVVIPELRRSNVLLLRSLNFGRVFRKIRDIL